MASATPRETDYSMWPVIVHKDLTTSPVSKLLIQKRIKFRTSSVLNEATIIFPKAKVAFLIVELTKPVLDELERDDQSTGTVDQSPTIARIDKLKCFHGHPFVLLMAPQFTGREYGAISRLQTRYLSDKVDFLPAHEAEEAVAAMLTVADLQTPPKSDILHQRFRQLRSSLLAPSSLLRVRPS